jgi:hypothetical protein
MKNDYFCVKIPNGKTCVMKKLPIGTQSFENLRKNDCIYIDKTGIIHQMISEGRIYFLSRPRRFGKSLLVSTLEAIFRGQKELFEGLYIYNRYTGKVLLLGIAFSGRQPGCRMETINKGGD